MVLAGGEVQCAPRRSQGTLLFDYQPPSTVHLGSAQMSEGRPHRGNTRLSQPRGRGRGRGQGRGSSKQRNGAPNISNQQMQQLHAGQGVKLEFMPSISRSGGDEGIGDSLKDEAIQTRYWEMIREKISAHWSEFPSRSDNPSPSQIEREGNLLLLLRKLREGVLSSQRKDEFALDAYETSFYLAIIFHSSAQASSSLPHLSELYKTLLSGSQTKDDSLQSRAEVFAIISLVFHLSEAFPSQVSFQRQMQSLEPLIGPMRNEGAALEWVSSIRSSINCRNYTRIENLTCERRLRSVMETSDYLAGSQKAADAGQQHHAQKALYSAVNELRRKVRGAVWIILRSAYREITFGSETDTASWLSRSCLLEAVGNSGGIDAEDWMERCEKEGHAVKKEGFQGRWILRK